VVCVNKTAANKKGIEACIRGCYSKGGGGALGEVDRLTDVLTIAEIINHLKICKASATYFFPSF